MSRFRCWSALVFICVASPPTISSLTLSRPYLTITTSAPYLTLQYIYVHHIRNIVRISFSFLPCYFERGYFEFASYSQPRPPLPPVHTERGEAVSLQLLAREHLPEVWHRQVVCLLSVLLSVRLALRLKKTIMNFMLIVVMQGMHFVRSNISLTESFLLKLF